MRQIPLAIPPGVQANGTEYQNKPHWVRSNLVRWREGAIKPVGGWQALATEGDIENVCRSLFGWRDNSGFRYLALGTTDALLAYDDTGTLSDVTPEGLASGRADAVRGNGYGYGPYGAEAYGTARTPAPGTEAQARVTLPTSWSFDNFGQVLVAISLADRRLVSWQPPPATTAPDPAVFVENAPPGFAVLVTEERHVVVLGADGDPVQVAWASRETLDEWSPLPTNTAGSFRLQTVGTLRTALRARGEVLLLTTQDAHTMNFVGSPFVYGFEQVGSACGIISPKAGVAVRDFAVWMGEGSWFVYDGVVRPLTSSVQDYVFRDINPVQKGKAFAALNTEHDEVWWFYPSTESEEIDRYVIWNYTENHWAVGSLERTAWTNEAVYPNPTAVSAEGTLYAQEIGWTADGDPLLDQRFLESAPLEIDNGDRLAVVTQMIPDELNRGQVQARFSLRNSPNGPETEKGPFPMSDYVDLRFTARQVQIRLEGAEDEDWRIGTNRLRATEGARR